jgi:hypothetical protein
MRMFRNIEELAQLLKLEVTSLSLATRKEYKLGAFHGEAIRRTPGPKREEVTVE